MRRLIAIFLLLIVPLQLGYAAAAAYCQHETGSAAGHFGHHAHEHRAQAGADQENGKGKGKLSLQLDQDCGLCHLQMPQLLTQHTTMTPTSVEISLYLVPVIAYSSADRRRLERPNWTLLL